MIVFADSSAIVTFYATTEMNALPPTASVVASDLARVEVPSALWRKIELGDMAATDVARLVREFEADWRGTRYRSIALVTTVLERAAGLTGTHRLRSLDAIQLACALEARDAARECRTMVVLDARLRNAAAAEGFDILPA